MHDFIDGVGRHEDRTSERLHALLMHAPAAILEQLPLGVLIADAENGQPLFANDKVREILGYDLPQVNTLDDYGRLTVIHADGTPFAAHEYPIVRAITRGEIISNEELHYERGDGSRGWLIVSASPIRDNTGRIMAGIVIFTDITDRKNLLEGERGARTAAEAAVRRQTLLAAATAVLSRAMRIDQLLDDIARIVVPALADVYFVDLRDGAELRRVGWSVSDAVDRSFEQIARLVPGPDAHRHPVRIAIETGEPVFLPSVDVESLSATVTDEEHRRFITDIGLRSLISVPLRARGAVIGALTLTVLDTSGREYTRDDLDLVMDLAARIAQAVDTVRIFTREQAARREAERAVDRTERLLRVSAALAAAVTREEVAETALREGIAAVGAAAGGLGVLVDNGERLERLAMVGYPAEIVEATRYVPLDALGPVATTARTGQAVWLETNEQLFARYPELDSIPARHEFGAAVSVPIEVGGRVIGVMSHRYREDRPFDSPDRDMMLAIARQCGVALERARLYEAERVARADAEAAVQARDEFLSIASHELKTPVAALKASAQLLLRRKERGAIDETYLVRTLHTFNETSDRLTRLTSDLLDVSRLRTGKLSLLRQPVDPFEVVTKVVEEIQGQIDDRHTVLLDVVGVLPLLSLDATRIEQVLANLLENAVKYSPSGGQIHVRVHQEQSGVVLSVRDAGIGLSPGSEEAIFEPFGRAPNAAESGVPGMGLGLHISRTIVEQHGGRIWAESHGDGHGTTFSLWLPAE